MNLVADPIFDPSKAKTALAQQFENTQRARDVTLNVLTDVHQRLATINKQQIDALSAYSEQTNKQFNTMTDALDKISNAERYPEGVSQIIGLFDSDFDIEHQKRRLQRSEFELNRIETQNETRKRAAALAGTTAAQEAATATTIFQYTRENFLDTQAMAEFGFAVEENVHKQSVRRLQNLSDEELNKYVKNPAEAPGEFQGKRGLLQTELIGRKSAAEGLNASVIARQINEELLSSKRTRNLLDKLDNKSLETAISIRQLPPGIDIAVAQDELNRRRSVEQALQSADIAITAGNAELAAGAKATALSGFTIEELTQGLDQAQKSGGRVSVSGIEFTLPELRASLFAKQRALDEQQLYSLDKVTAAAATTSIAVETETRAQGLAAVYNPGAPFDSENLGANLPPRLHAEVMGIQAELRALQEAQKSGINTASAQVAAFKKLNEVMKRERDLVIKAQPAPSKAAYEEFIDTGSIENVTAAADHLVASSSPYALNYDPLLGSEYEIFANTLNELAGVKGQQYSINPDTGSFSIKQTSKLDSSVLVANALKDADTVNRLAQRFTVDLLARTIKNLAGAKENSIWQGIVDPATGEFDERVFTANSDGTRSFSREKFNTLLAAKTAKYREDKIIPPGQSMTQILVAETRKAAPALRHLGTQDPTAAAFMKMVFNNNPQLAVGSLLSRINAGDQPALARVLEQRELMIENTQKAAEIANDPAKGRRSYSDFPLFSRPAIKQDEPQNEIEALIRQTLQPPEGAP